MSHALALCGASEKWPFRLTVTMLRNGTDFSMRAIGGMQPHFHKSIAQVPCCFVPLLLRFDIMR